MQPSIFNVRVPLRDQSDVFLMNTLTDAQIVVPPEVVSLLDSLEGRTQPEARRPRRPFDDEERQALATLTELGFVVESHDADRRALDDFFDTIRDDTSQLRLTVLTTLQCNFACGYCIQGDHDDYNRHAHKMSLETAAEVVAHAERQLDTVRPERLSLTFFGGEPLLNLPVVYYLAEHVHAAAAARGVPLMINIITNGLLLTPEVVDRLLPFGLNGVKITLDGDKATHDRMRPLRGGQGTFDRIIANIRAVAGKCRISIGGNFDADNADSYPALLDFLAAQDFAPQHRQGRLQAGDRRRGPAPAAAVAGRQAVAHQRHHPADRGRRRRHAARRHVHDRRRRRLAAARRRRAPCDSCHFVDETMGFLREETRKRGFPTIDGVHMGPCEIHRKHAHTIGPDGALYACPGFTGESDARHRPHHRRPTPVQAKAADQLRPHRRLAPVRRLLVHPGVRRRLQRRLAHRTR